MKFRVTPMYHFISTYKFINLNMIRYYIEYNVYNFVPNRLVKIAILKLGCYDNSVNRAQ